MKFLKSQNTSKYSPSDNAIKVNPYGRITTDSTNSFLLPRGTTAERPGYDAGSPDVINYSKLEGLIEGGDLNGALRYNTTTGIIEGYVGGFWETLKAPGASAVLKQTLGPGTAVADIFGPLARVPDSADNIIVLVENVFQISTTNFVLVQNPTSSGLGEEIVAPGMVDGTEYVIVDITTGTTTDFTLVGAGWEDAGTFTIGASYTIKVPGDTDFVAIGAADNNIGTVFTATGNGSGTGKALPSTYTQSVGDVFVYDDSNGIAIGDSEVREAGTYIQFASPVDIGKYVTVYFGYAG